MNAAALDTLQTVQRWLADGHAASLFTVIETWGAAPRPVGALMAIRDDGQAVGSVSGGCIEDDLIAAHAHERATGASICERLRYGVAAETARRFGLPCGGSVELVRERITGVSDIGGWIERASQGRAFVRELDLATGRACYRDLAPGEQTRIEQGRLCLACAASPRLLLIGAGQLSLLLARLALALDWRVTVCDPRDAYDEPWQELTAVARSREMPDDCVRTFKPDATSAIVALTHDPKLDDLALIEALAAPALYVGALGSRRSQAVRRERLRDLGLDEAQLARLHGPAGLPIGAETAAEIALSIMAELTAYRRGVRAGALAALPGSANRHRPQGSGGLSE